MTDERMRTNSPGDSDSKLAHGLVDMANSPSTRRAFLRGVGRKAAYMTPVILTLSATNAVASSASVSCKPLAGSCDTNADCCSNNCDTNICI